MKLKVHQDVYVSLVVLIPAIYFLVKSLEFPFEASLYPVILIGMILFFNLFILFGGLRKTKLLQSGGSVKQFIKWDIIRKPLIVFGFMTVYVILFDVLNYFIATPLLMVLLMLYFKVRDWKTLVFVPVGYLVFTYVCFVWQLKVPLF